MSERDVEKEALMLGGKGVESFFTRFKMKRRGVAVSAGVGLAAALIVVGTWLAAVSPMTTSLAANWLWNPAGDEPVARTIQCRLDDWAPGSKFKCGSATRPAEYVSTTVTVAGGKTLLTRSEYQTFLDSTLLPAGYAWWTPNPITLFKFILFGSLLCVFPLASAFAFRFFVSGGNEETKNKRIDGVHNLITGKELSKRVIDSETGGCGWKLVDVDLPHKTMVMGLSVIGMQGTGKSLALHDLIMQAEKKDVRLFINDPAGEFWQAHGKPENGDVFFNPALLGGVDWSIFKELEYEYDSDILANAFLPKREGKGSGEFFDDAARSLFSAIVRRLAELGAVNTSEVARAFFELSEDELSALVAGTAAADAVSSDAKGMRAGVMASAGIHMSGLAMMAAGEWNFRDFLDAPKGNIYFVGDEPKFRAVKRLMFTTALEVIKNRNVKHRDIKYLFVLDEYPILGDIDIDRHLAEKRKFGVSITVGMQNDAQFITMVGESRADTTLGVIGTSLQLRVADAKSQKRAEASFGGQNVRMVAESQTLAIAEAKDSLGINKTQQEKALIMAAKFGMLEDLTGYMRVIGGFPSAKVNYRGWFKVGSSSDGKGTKADEVSNPIRDYPARDPRFLLKVTKRGTWEQGLHLDVLKAQIESVKNQIPMLSQQAAKEKKQALLANLEKNLAMLEGGEVAASDQKFGIEAMDLDMNIDLETGEILPDDDGMLI